VLEKSECNEESNFRSSREMQGAPQIAHGGICLHSKTIHEKRLGECADGTCSPNEASCDGLDFADVEQSTGTCIVENTSFGRCGDRCSWTSDDCTDEVWTFPSQECSCDQVQVGACQKDGLIFCAVSSDSCDDEATWLSPMDVTTTTSFRCYLCREKTQVQSNNNAVDNEETIPGISKRSNGSVIGAVVGSLAGAVIVLILFVFVRKRQGQNSNGVVKAPLPSVDINKDDVSVL